MKLSGGPPAIGFLKIRKDTVIDQVFFLAKLLRQEPVYGFYIPNS